MLLNFSEKAFDIIIQAGQSNAEGYGFGDVENAYQPNPAVWYLNNDFTISRAAELVVNNGVQSNFALSFAQRYIDNNLLSEGRELLILRCAVGGTGFLDNHWKLTDDLYLRMMEMIKTALSLNPSNRLVAFLWHQGENDAIDNADYDTHYNNLSTLLNSVINTFEVPNIPFIAGDFVHDWKDKNLSICEPVIKAIQSVCNNHTNGRFVESEGLKSNAQVIPTNHPLGWGDTDVIHFSRSSLYELGNRYFDAFLTCL